MRSNWGVDRAVDNFLLSKVIFESAPSILRNGQPLEVVGARIVGPVDFRASIIARPIYFRSCLFTDMIDCTDAQIVSMSFENCRLGELRLRYAQIAGSLLIRDCEVSRPLDLLSARIARDVDLRGCNRSHPGRVKVSRLRFERLTWSLRIGANRILPLMCLVDSPQS